MQPIRPTPPSHRDARALRELAREILAGLLGRGLDELPCDVALRDLGVDSRTAVSLISALSTRLSRTLPATLVYSYPTLDALARHIADGDAQRIDDSDLPVDEPIAIIGIGCRFPGGANDPHAYFELLRSGVDAVGPCSDARHALLHGEAASAEPRLHGGFLDDVAGFDEAFFGISPREASEMDPQQRLMLEVSWEALEDAGVAPSNLAGTRTGVFVGAMWQDYAHHSAALAHGIEQHTATGLDTSVIAARVSYRLGLRGPSLTLNSACSSALVAVHLACQSLRQRESTLALAGGVNLILSPHSSIAMARFGALSPDARCKAFDASANGYVRGEGAGIVVLKRLSDAVAAGDPIYCVIRGSAVNNDGASNGLAAPSRAAQAQVLRDAYARARISPSRVQYVEAHGTGTRLGDPIEAEALGEVIGGGRTGEQALRIGSVKTNLGHLEAAAGIASIIKVALAIRHRFLPPSLHLQHPNPEIDFEHLGLHVQRDGGGWPHPDRTPLAGVSAFGFGGTNAHVVLEGPHQARHELLVLAADDAETLQARIERVRDAAAHVESADGLRALCCSSAQHWSSGARRAACVVSCPHELGALLEQREPSVAHEAPRIVFAYSGVGSQWPGMARALLATEPVFRDTLDRCDAAIEQLTGRSVREDLWLADPRVLARCERYQPMIFSVQVALSALLESYGVMPDLVLGHSIGEVAAAHRAGILDLGDAAAVICHMSRLESRTAGDGAMALLGMRAGDAETWLRELMSDAVIAAENGAHSTVVSGPREAVATLIARARDRGVFAAPVQSDIAYHHPMLRSALQALPAALGALTPQAARIPMWSTTDRRFVAGAECDGRYFTRNQISRVWFAEAIDMLRGRGDSARPISVVELGPHPLLVRELREGLARGARPPTVVPCMTRDDDEGRPTWLHGLAELFRAGHPLRLRTSSHTAARTRLPLGARRFMPLGASHDVDDDLRPFTLPISAISESALRAMSSSLGAHLDQHPAIELPDLIHKVARTRSGLPQRATVTATTRQGLRHALDALSRGDHARGLVALEPGRGAPHEGGGRLAFVFSGHGSQWQGMCAELLRTEPVFAEAIDTCDAALARLGPHRVRAALEASDGRFPTRADRIQPLLFATQVALARLWLSWGVRPDVVMGHSVGEIAAAHVAGMLDLNAAARVVTERAAALAPAIGAGAMALVELPLNAAQEIAERYADRIAVAVHHSPTCSVLAGEREALREVLQELDARQVFCRWVDVDYASHGPQMQPIALGLRERLRDLPTCTARSFPMFSTTLGRTLHEGECDAAYWAQNLARPVLFREAVEELVRDCVTTFLEVSPHPLLGNGILETARALPVARATTFIPSLRRNAPQRQALQEALGQLFVAGQHIDWSLQHSAGDLSVRLPAYPFERRRHWKSSMPRLASALAANEVASCETPRTTSVAPQVAVASIPLIDALRGESGESARTRLLAFARGELAALLRTDAARIEPHARFQDLGVDSLLGLELRSRIQTRIGVALSSTSMWDKPTLEGLVSLLVEQINACS